MIREKKKSRYKEPSLKEELTNYIKTAGVAFIVAAVISMLLSFHARSEMIKNIYVSKEEKSKLDILIAKKMVEQSDLTQSLHKKSYNICLQIGNIYETAGDLEKAEYAYTLAYNKAPEGNLRSHYKLAEILISQEKFDEAQKIIDSVYDTNNVKVIKFKTRVNIIMGDKYNEIDKYLKAAGCYQNASYYYNTLTKKDKRVEKSIDERLSTAYINTADVLVKNGYNSDAVRFLKKALKVTPEKFIIKYKLAIIYADLDPELSIEYFNYLLDKMPQQIDYRVYNRALMKAANIADLEGNTIKSKLYRYKIHSIDLFLKQKVVYTEDVNVILEDFITRKRFFTYKLNAKFKLMNNSSVDINKIYAEFILRQKNKPREIYNIQCASKKNPLLSNGGVSNEIAVKFGNKIFTKKELENYYIDVYLYKDKKYKTFFGSFRVPLENRKKTD